MNFFQTLTVPFPCYYRVIQTKMLLKNQSLVKTTNLIPALMVQIIQIFAFSGSLIVQLNMKVNYMNQTLNHCRLT